MSSGTHSNSLFIRRIQFLVGDTNDTASRTASSVTSLLGLLVATLAKVVSAGVDDNGALSKRR